MWEVLGALLIGSAVSGVVPLVNAEVLVIGAAAATPGIGVPLVAAVSTLGQMLTKTILFAVARWAPSKLPEKARATLDRTSKVVSGRGGAAWSIVFASAAVGLPPFYGVSLACGALGMRLRSFVLSGAAGRALRFGALAWAGHRFGAQATDLLAGGAASVAVAAG